MTEYRLFDGEVAYVSTAAFHADRDRAAHLEQADHRGRMLTAAGMILRAMPQTVVDLGCGDGGLLQVLGQAGMECWGYDFAPANAAGWPERGVKAELRDVFTTRDVPHWGELVVLTEVLEHLTDPHGTVEWIAHHCRWVVASSPWFETDTNHADEHAWAWDRDGYAKLFADQFTIIEHRDADWSQIVWAESRHGMD